LAAAIAEAEADANMHEMEDDGMPVERVFRSPNMDILHVGGAAAGGREARSSRAEEIRRGKQPMTPSHEEGDKRPRQQNAVDKLLLGNSTPRSPMRTAATTTTPATPVEPTIGGNTGQTKCPSPRQNPRRPSTTSIHKKKAKTPWGLWSTSQSGKAETTVSHATLTATWEET
jgi:hypothetical protein